jgi:hypothetical protein
LFIPGIFYISDSAEKTQSAALLQFSSFSFLIVNFVLFVAKFFSSRHKGTKTLRKNNKIKSFMSLCLGGKYFLVPACPG